MIPWRDAYGREHPEIPRCEAYGEPRGFVNKYGRPCTRKGVRKRVDAPGWKDGREHWFCEQHDPLKVKPEDLQEQVRELRKALAALLPVARYGLRAVDPMAAQLGAREWRKAVHRAEQLVEGT